MAIEQGIIDFFEAYGQLGLALLSFTESFIEPVPADVLFIPMVYSELGNTGTIIWLWLIITITSILGGLVGYWIGANWGLSIIRMFGAEKYIKVLESFADKYGDWGIFIAAFTPIPFKVCTWIAGMGDMELKPFVTYSLAGRGLRYGIEALLVVMYGAKAVNSFEWFLDNEIYFAIIMIVGIAIAVLGLRRWNAYTNQFAQEE